MGGDGPRVDADRSRTRVGERTGRLQRTRAVVGGDEQEHVRHSAARGAVATVSVMSIARNGTCELFHESFGDPSDPALLMINGLGSQCTNFATEWIQMFVDRGLHVIRYDNRDVGKSTWEVSGI